MLGVAIFLFCIGTAFLLGAAFFYYIVYIFSKRNDKLATTLGFLKKTTHAKNVHIRGGGTIKDLCTGTYSYKVGQKSYQIKRDNFVGKPGQMPQTAGIKYLKGCPKIAEVKDCSTNNLLNAIILSAFSALSFIFAFAFLFI